MDFYAYVYRNPSRNNEPIYVGKGRSVRAYKHLTRKDAHPLTHRIRVIRQADLEPQIEVIAALDEDHAFFLESCLVEVFGRKDLGTGSLLNLTDGGEGESGRQITTEARINMSVAHKGKPLSPESIAKRTASVKGSKRTPETRTKMSAAQLGKKHSLESKAKMSAAHKGKKLSADTIIKMTIANKGKNLGRKRSPEARARMSVAQMGNKNATRRKTHSSS